jgi:hypothetical protein
MRKRNGPWIWYAVAGVIVLVAGLIVLNAERSAISVKPFSIHYPSANQVSFDPNISEFCTTVNQISEPGGVDEFSWYQALRHAPQTVRIDVQYLYNQVQKGKGNAATVNQLKAIGAMTCSSQS